VPAYSAGPGSLGMKCCSHSSLYDTADCRLRNATSALPSARRSLLLARYYKRQDFKRPHSKDLCQKAARTDASHGYLKIPHPMSKLDITLHYATYSRYSCQCSASSYITIVINIIIIIIIISIIIIHHHHHRFSPASVRTQCCPQIKYPSR
jgi:hypothetical protein